MGHKDLTNLRRILYESVERQAIWPPFPLEGGLVILSILALAFVIACGSSDSGDNNSPNPGPGNGNNGNGQTPEPPPPPAPPPPVIEQLYISTQPTPSVNWEGARPNLTGMVVQVTERLANGTINIREETDVTKFVTNPMFVTRDSGVMTASSPVNTSYTVRHVDSAMVFSINPVQLHVIRQLSDDFNVRTADKGSMTGVLYQDRTITDFTGATVAANYVPVDLTANTNIAANLRRNYIGEEWTRNTIQLDSRFIDEDTFWNGIDVQNMTVEFEIRRQKFTIPATDIAKVRAVTMQNSTWGPFLQYARNEPTGLRSEAEMKEWWIRQYFEAGAGELLVEYNLTRAESRVRIASKLF